MLGKPIHVEHKFFINCITIISISYVLLQKISHEHVRFPKNDIPKFHTFSEPGSYIIFVRKFLQLFFA